MIELARLYPRGEFQDLEEYMGARRFSFLA
jgi:hypothetical protein